MDSYQVEFSDRFNRDIAEIEQDDLSFGPVQTGKYIEAIFARCERLATMPERGTPIRIRGLTYHRFTQGGHTIYYRVFADERRVIVEACLRGKRDFKRHL